MPPAFEPQPTFPPFPEPAHVRDLRADLAAADARLRDLVSRLGFGNGVTEPMADNDVIVQWFKDEASLAGEWRESQRWRDDCYLAGCPDGEDCHEHDPSLQLETADARLAAVAALCERHEADHGGLIPAPQLRAALGIGPRRTKEKS